MSERAMDTTSAAAGLRFGTASRAKRDDPEYQRTRLEALCAFTLRLLDAYRRRLELQERRGREVWQSKGWLDGALVEQRVYADELLTTRDAIEQQRGAWEKTAKQAQAEIERLTKWIQELEAGKAWLDEQRQTHEREIVRLEGMVAELRGWASSQEQARERLYQYSVYRALRRLRLLPDMSTE